MEGIKLMYPRYFSVSTGLFSFWKRRKRAFWIETSLKRLQKRRKTTQKTTLDIYDMDD